MTGSPASTPDEPSAPAAPTKSGATTPEAKAAPGGPWRGLLLALTFLTRLPIPIRKVCGGDHGWALAHFPLIGGAVGGAMFSLAQLARGFGLASGVTAFLIVCLHAYLTGALHLDGVADLCDAAGGGRGDRQRMLAIMKDSRIGAHGATGLVLVIAGRLVATAELVEQGHLWPLLVSPVVARFCLVLALVTLPYARQEGLGAIFKQEVTAPHVAIATTWTLVALLGLGSPTLALLPVALGATVMLGAWASKRLGGLTGDVYGAIIEVSEVATLVAAT